jgi:hypothetical protein
MPVKNSWASGDVFRASDANAVANAVNSHYARSISTVTSAVTIGAAAGTDYVVFVGTGGAPSMPTAVGNTNRYSIKNIANVPRTLSCIVGGQTIDGSSSISLIPDTSVDLVSDNSNWRVI